MVELVEGPQDERIEGGGRRFESDEHVIAGIMDCVGRETTGGPARSAMNARG
jgi:hypothetical protein